VNGTDLVLDSFSFWLNDGEHGYGGLRRLRHEWNGAVEPRHGSDSLTARKNDDNNGGANGDERFDFLTGGLLLNASNTYVAFQRQQLLRRHERHCDHAVGDPWLTTQMGHLCSSTMETILGC
jgi:hypothetical protein